jgi:hypothetical protein
MRLEGASAVNWIAIVNLIAYIFLSGLIAYLILLLPLPLLFLGLLYSFVGIACSFGLFYYRKWSWYAAVATWIIEGLVSCWVAIANALIVNLTDPQSVYYMNPLPVLTFVLIALERFAAVIYLAKAKTKQTFHVQRK